MEIIGQIRNDLNVLERDSHMEEVTHSSRLNGSPKT